MLYAANKENEIPKLISTILEKFSGGSSETPQIGVYNKHMRSAEEIMKDYGIGG